MKRLFLSFTIVSVLFSCKPDKSEPEKTLNYYPLEEGQQANFKVMLINTWPAKDKDSCINYPDYPLDMFPENSGVYDSGKWKYDKDTIIEGKKYAFIYDKNRSAQTWVRKENGKYYKLMWGSSTEVKPEGLFLKDELKVGETWTNTFDKEYLEKEVYKVLFLRDELTIEGKSYKNVVGIQCDTYRGIGADLVTQVRYYSDGVGEIYAYVEYPFSWFYAHSKSFRLQ